MDIWYGMIRCLQSVFEKHVVRLLDLIFEERQSYGSWGSVRVMVWVNNNNTYSLVLGLGSVPG